MNVFVAAQLIATAAEEVASDEGHNLTLGTEFFRGVLIGTGLAITRLIEDTSTPAAEALLAAWGAYFDDEGTAADLVKNLRLI